MKFLVTGAAGFIGYHVAKYLLARGDIVTGVDNLNPYYDPNLKQSRLNLLKNFSAFNFFAYDIANVQDMEKIFVDSFDVVLHFAAQAGVRYSLENPLAYAQSNLVGFTNILEFCRQTNIKHLVFASSSSVYGANSLQPFSEHHRTDHPVSFYAATKKANEVMAHSYAAIYNLPCTGLRFFTVYGPWGRPDMALFKFTNNILSGLPIEIYNQGNLLRDFTYIDDIVAGVVKVVAEPAVANCEWNSDDPDTSSSFAPYRIYNIGNNKPIKLMHFIETLEKVLNKKSKKIFFPMQAGDVYATYADVTELSNNFNFHPNTTLHSGISNFVAWYREYYNK